VNPQSVELSAKIQSIQFNIEISLIATLVLAWLMMANSTA